jgi:UbiD family decarboxylase
VVDPQTGRRNVGCRRLSLRNRYETGTNVTAPSDLKRIYTAAVARGEKLPISFTVGSHPLDFVAATTRLPGDELALVATFRGEPAPVVKCLTNDILVPADAEMVLEGYLDERGYVEPEGPFGEYMGYYGAIHMDPVFHCTAISMRRDVLHHTLLHGSAFVLDQTDSANITAMRTEAEAMRILKGVVREPVAAYLRTMSGGANTLRVSIRQRVYGEARSAIAALFGGIMRLKHVYVFDDDIDIRDDRQVEWAIGTRFQADQDMVILQGMMGMTMDPSLQGRRTGAKAGFDCTKPFGRDGEIPLTRSAAKVFKGPARYQSVEQALGSGPMFYADLVEGVGSDDGREVACALDELRGEGRLGRDRDGRYHLVRGKPGETAIVGELYHDPNAGT